MATTNIQGLSPKAKEVLQRNAESRQRDNKFIKIEPGQKKILKFDPEKIEQVEAEFNGKKSMRFRYTVIEEGSSNANQEKIIDSYRLIEYLTNSLKILRKIEIQPSI